MKVVVGLGSCGIAAGARKVYEELEYEMNNNNLDIDLETTGCIGMCHLEPIVDIYHEDGSLDRYVKSTGEEIINIIKETPKEKRKTTHKISEEDQEALDRQVRIAIENCGIINPEKLDEYLEKDGYKGLEKVLTEMTPEDVIEEIKNSGLRGRGGAGFPTWFKWDAASKQIVSPKYMVCNADEGDPGAFMDRSILEGDPHRLLEGMAIGAYAIGAEEGIIYVRAEYPLAIKRLNIAMGQAREKGYLGKNIFGTDFNFDVRIKAGAGAFVCGEETALIASLEGERGMPRLKPPFPAEKGFWGQPTNINNVETFANVPWIIRKGGPAFSAYGTEKSNGTKLFALTGKIKKGGLIEVPMGMPIKEVIYDIGGGILNDKKFKAVQMGGPSGGCIPAHLDDTTVDYESLSVL